MLNLQITLLLLLPCTAILAVGTLAASEKNRSESLGKPNIVYIMADDMGVGDVKCFGKEKSRAETPNIDALARAGIMFTDAHAPVAHCIPTRVAVMTGRYYFRFARTTPDGPWGFINPRLPEKQSTLATVLKRGGYRTTYVGKWHLGLQMQTKDGKNQGAENVDFTKPVRKGPNDFGFDESFILPGSLDMFPYVFLRNQNWLGPVNSKKGWSAFNRIGPAADDFEDHKVLDRFASEAEACIQKNVKLNDPFFLYLALTSPHTPTSPGKRFRGKSKLGLYGDFLMETDDCVGRVLQALEKQGIRKNTLVVFTSDHGAANYAGNIAKATVGQSKLMEKIGHYSSGIYRGHKFSIYEGGTRIPLVASWPGVTEPGKKCSGLIGLNDVMATFAEAAGATLLQDEAPDSFSFLNLLSDPEDKPKRKFMICRSSNNFSIRQGKWKLALCPGSGCHGKWGNSPPRDQAWRNAIQEFGRHPKPSEIRSPPFCQLFDLESDPGEKNNLAEKAAEKIGELASILDQVIANGRSTPGPNLKNDRKFNLLGDVPRFAIDRTNN